MLGCSALAFRWHYGLAGAACAMVCLVWAFETAINSAI
jgi:hypothetical protein